MPMNHRPTNKHLLICHINPWSVCNKAEAINDFISEHHIDILTITETWLTGTASDGPVISALLPEGYSIVHAPRGTRGGGIAMVYRQTLHIIRAETPSSLGTFEVLECVVKGLQWPLRVCTVYQPHKTSAFVDEVGGYLSTLIAATGHLIVLGDFNLHVNDPADKIAQDFLSTTAALGLQQHVNKPTHQNGNTLDLLLTPSDTPLDFTWEAMDYGFKDHFPIFLRINVTKPALPKMKITYRKTKSITADALRNAISLDRLRNCEGRTSLQHLITTYQDELEATLNAVAPLKTREITMRPDARWFSDEIRTAKQQRRKAERKWRKTGLCVHREIYIAAKDRVTALIISEKKKYYKDQVASCAGDQQKLFGLVTSLLGKSVSSPLPSDDPEVLAQRFSDFFLMKIQHIQESIPMSPRDSAHIVNEQRTIATPLTSFSPITPDELTRLVSASPNKQCDLDPMPTKLLKLLSVELCPLIRTIINRSITTGVVPNDFKTALVIPRLKKPSLNIDELGNYRPVSNLSFLSKTLERVVAAQLRKHLEVNNLQEINQSAYRKHHSTETALLKVHTDIRQAVAERMVVLMAMLDLSSAFDTISHELLLHSLSSIGIQGTAFEWLKSYISDRTQIVMTKGARSNPAQLTTGVPQGSVLGPLLFCIYTNSLGSLLRSHGVEFHIYADDTQVYLRCAPDKIKTGIQRLERTLDDVQRWMSERRLKLNASKTEFIVFSSKETAKHLPSCTLRVSGHDIIASDCVRNIGILMDRTLTGERQVNHTCRLAYAQLKSLSRIKCFVDNESLEMIMHALITTRIDYCNSLYYGINGRLVHKLQTLQNACARLLTNASRFDHITPVLTALHWLPVKQRCVFKLLVITFKCLHGTAPTYLCDLIVKHHACRDVRSNNSMFLHVPFTRCHTLYSTTLPFTAPRLWNMLPAAIRSANTLTAFKSMLKTHLFAESYP